MGGISVSAGIHSGPGISQFHFPGSVQTISGFYRIPADRGQQTGEGTCRYRTQLW